MSITAVNTSRATLLFIVLNLACLLFSQAAYAIHRHALPQMYDNYQLDAVSLTSIYRHDADNIWLVGQRPNEQARIAIEFIASASDHGLDPDDYHYDHLLRLDPSADPAQAGLFDLLLTDGLLKFIHDLAVGRLDPKIVDPKWAIPRASFDATAYLQHALLVDGFKARLEALIPNSSLYRLLQAAVNRYQDYVDRGGWKVVPATPVLRPGDFHQHVPLIRERLAFEGSSFVSSATMVSTRYDTKLEQAVVDFQRRYGLKVDGIIGPETLIAMNVPAVVRLQQIKINLERLRWLPDDLGKRYIFVNLANYRLTAVDEDTIKLDMRVIVGQAKRSTPSFASKMTHVVFNPYWNVPRKLARLDLLPKQQSDPDYFEKFKIRIFDHQNGKRTEVDPDSIDWSSINLRRFPYLLRQDPGEKNALGRMKFMTPNRWSINLHDTPVKSLFNRNQRNFSSGCIRVEDPLALANFTLGERYNRETIADIYSSNKHYKTMLEEPIPVYAVYVTVWSGDNGVMFSPDSYRRDQRMAEHL